MQKLLLTSEGIQPELKNDFLSLLTKSPEETTVAFIPTACDVDKDQSYVAIARNMIQNTGVKIYDVDLKGENEASLLKKLSPADVIFVNGGSTFYLLKKVRESGFDKAVKKLITEGKIYIGLSAGTYIACPTIEMATAKHHPLRDREDVTDFTSLNLVPFIITVHYQKQYEEIIKE